jgi:hypothetical protein
MSMQIYLRFPWMPMFDNEKIFHLAKTFFRKRKIGLYLKHLFVVNHKFDIYQLYFDKENLFFEYLFDDIIKLIIDCIVPDRIYLRAKDCVCRKCHEYNDNWLNVMLVYKRFYKIIRPRIYIHTGKIITISHLIRSLFGPRDIPLFDPNILMENINLIVNN